MGHIGILWEEEEKGSAYISHDATFRPGAGQDSETKQNKVGDTDVDVKDVLDDSSFRMGACRGTHGGINRQSGR